MNSSGISVTACRFCQHYNPEGRRGGFCEKLEVPVISTWEACSLSKHPFESTTDLDSILHESLNSHVAMSERFEMQEWQEVQVRSLIFAEH